MDPQGRFLIAMVEAALELNLVLIVIAMAEAALERGKQKKWKMEQSLSAHQAALQEKEMELAMLMTKKEEMLAEESAKKNMVDDFMVFIDAIENNDPEIAQNFDEKAMMNAILPMLRSDDGDGSDNGGFVGGDNVPKINLGPEEEAIKDAIIAMINSDGNCGGNNERFAGDNGGGINNVPENAQNLGDEALVAANNGKNSDGSEE